jgi:hypothetical protein
MKVGQGFHSGPDNIKETAYGSSGTRKINHTVKVNWGYIVKQNKKSTIIALSGPAVALFDKKTGNFIQHGCTYQIYCIHNKDAFNAILHSSCEDANKAADPCKSISGKIEYAGYQSVN